MDQYQLTAFQKFVQFLNGHGPDLIFHFHVLLQNLTDFNFQCDHVGNLAGQSCVVDIEKPGETNIIPQLQGSL